MRRIWRFCLRAAQSAADRRFATHLGRAQRLPSRLRPWLSRASPSADNLPATRTRYSFFDAGIFANQRFGHPAILGQHQEPGGIDIQPAGRGQAAQVFALKAQRRRITAPAPLGQDQATAG